ANLRTANVFNLPKLQIALLNGRPVISWSGATADFELQETDSLSPQAVWKRVSRSVETQDTGFSVTLDTSSPLKFYRLVPGPVFSPGEVSKTVTVHVKPNRVYEPTKTFSVGLANPVNAIIAKGRGTGTILNDDPLPTLSINDVQVKKNTSGTTDAVFTISLNGATAVPVSVHYVTADGTAKAPGNYQSTSGDLNFAPGQTTKTVAVKVVGNAIFEP